MDMLNEYLSSKAEHIAWSLYSYTLRAKQRRTSGCYYRYHGLQTLIYSEETKLPKRILHCYNMSNKTKTTTTPKDSNIYSWQWQSLAKSLWSTLPDSQSTITGDLIGAESGDCMSCDLIDELISQSQSQRKCFREKKRENKKEFPPAITLLRETGGAMPWCHKKEFSADGRLIIKAERVTRYCEHMDAHRENGRLTMMLVHDDDGWPIYIDGDKDEDGEEEEEEEDLTKEDSSEVFKNEFGRCWADLHQSFSYSSGGFVRDLEFYMGQSGSAPFRPITYVM